jgi:hypothetical protein
MDTTLLKQVTSRPSYCGLSAETLIASAQMTANVYGRAYILTTVSIPEWRAGGHVFVSTTENPQWPGAPYRTLLVLEEK